MMEVSVLIGGKAGFGIDRAGVIIGNLLNNIGYRIYIYRDYPSVIRGGHTFSIIRASEKRIATHKEKVDFILCLNQDTFNFHKGRLKDNSVVIYDSDSVKAEGAASAVKAIGIPVANILKEENAPEIMRNTCIIGAFSKAAGIGLDNLEKVLRKSMPRETEQNLKVASRGYNAISQVNKIPAFSQPPILPLVTGNEAIGLGLIKGGLEAYIAYPMTPASPLLHFLAEQAKDFDLEVIHPESEIGVILMAFGFSYTGKKVAVGTSGGGFCLMTEGLSFAGMSELPVVIMVGQRPGPSTGLPTYSSQTELNFVLNAGQGEFARFVVSPGDPEEAYFWSAVALNISWKYQVPSIILSDKTLGEGVYNFDLDSIKEIGELKPLLWDRKSPYKRYQNTETGISPMAFVPLKGEVVKINSYEHDELGITTEEPDITKLMQEKRMRKEKYLAQELEGYEAVKVYGKKDSSTGLLCWGSNKGVCIEAAEALGLKVVQPIAISPFPIKQFQAAVKNLKRIIAIESNYTAQLCALIKRYGFDADEKILKYDGRPFTVEELTQSLERII